MELREVIFENLNGDLDYDPKRGGLYLILGAAALCLSVLASTDVRFGPVPLVLGAGSLTLILKGVFLLRKMSTGLDTSQGGLSLSKVRSDLLTEGGSPSKTVRPWTAYAAQIVKISAQARCSFGLFCTSPEVLTKS